MKKAIILAMLLSIVPALGLAQSTMDHSQMQQQNSIDGQKNPELVPDKVAYRLWLINLSQAQADVTDNSLVIAHLEAIGISEANWPNMVSTLASFKKQFNALLSDYSSAASSRGNAPIDHTLLRSKFDTLVRSTRDQFNVFLTAKEVVRIDKLVQFEKHGMLISKTEVE